MKTNLTLDLEPTPINYIVHIQDSRGKRQIGCVTVQEVYRAKGTAYIGAITSVSSPVGLDVSQFIPY